MKTETAKLEAQGLPSKSDLVKATAIALVAAIVLLVTVVLPAEYGLDPLGTGAALGLTRLAAPAPAPEEMIPLEKGAALTPTQEGPLSHYPAEFRLDSTDLIIEPYEYLEYKYRLEKGASLQFSWTADSDLIHDFHGEPDGGKPDEQQSFDKQARRQANGSLIAPFSGIHGWYWENPGGQPIKVKLFTAGFYSGAVEIRSDHSRRNVEVTALENVNIPRKAEVANPAP